jgi:integrase
MERFSYKASLSKRASELYESYPEVRAWYEEVSALKSPRTSRDYVDDLASFAKDVGKSPKELIELSPKRAYGLMKDWAIKKLQTKSITVGRIHSIWYGVKSFLEFHGVEVKGEFPLKRKVKYLDKIPTKEELKLILDAAPSLSTKIAIQLMAYGGLRPEDVCDLTYASIKRDFEKGISPCAVYVPQSKSGEVYVTFIPEQTVNLIRQYFKLRRKRGEEISDSSPVLSGQKSEGAKGIRRKTLTMKIEQALRRSGLELSSNLGDKIQRMRPYSLRKYFRSNLTGHAPQEYIEAWMGHTYGLAQVYSGTRDLDPSTIERMRQAYKSAEKHLLGEAVEAEKIKQEAALEAIRRFAEAFGIDPMRIKIEKEKELGKELSASEEIELIQDEIKRAREEHGDPQRIVGENELEGYLAEGWQFVSILPSQRILIRRSSKD